jgi:hypothetical protein
VEAVSDILLTFDPAAHHVAWASFREARLEGCGLIRERVAPTLEMKFRASEKWAPMRAVVELPQVYNRRGAGDPNDLIAVAVTVGRIAQALGPLTPCEFVHPHDWKGSVPKKVMLGRIEKRLDENELLVLNRADVIPSLRHNVLDAIGIGLWEVGRL